MNFYYFYKIKKFIKKKKKAYAKVNEKKSLAHSLKIIKITSAFSPKVMKNTLGPKLIIKIITLALPLKVMKKYFSPPAKVKKKNL